MSDYMVYVHDLAKLISELKKEGYLFKKDETCDLCWEIYKENSDVGFVCCNTRSVIGVDAHINEIINKYTKPDMVKPGQEALSASEN